ncbi:MAG: CHASE2 domain-containing protein, partial [bacterium]
VHDDPGRFRGQLVLVGATYIGTGDVHRLPSRHGALVEVHGVVLQALIADTILTGFPFRQAGSLPMMIVTALGAAAVAGALLCIASVRPGLIAAGLLALAVLAAPLLALGSGVILPVLPPLGSLLLAAAVALTLRARLSAIPVVNDETE